MRDGIGIGGAAQGIVRRVLEIPDGTVGVASTLEVHGQLGRNLVRPRPIARLYPPPDLLMETHPVSGRHARIHYLVIRGMAELITRRDRPVRPGLGAVGLDEPPLACQSRI